ncbi:MAG TPA: aldehyde dehydrogenase family protein [Puia sp.]|nr:aldehyde dehydrogenase family protein [Puia sp.]
MHDLQPLRQFFDSGATRPYEWRRQQLQKMQQLILDNEKGILAALYTDLKKSPEEAYASETGLVLSEIRYMLKHLAGWMRPRRVRTNLVNWPSSSTIYRDPLGVVLIVAPWNYPLQLSLLPVAAALAAGNVVVLKPSEVAPATAAIIEKLLTSVYSPGCVRVVQGDGAVIVPGLIRNFRFDHIFFTGSAGVGRAIYQLAAEQLIPVTLELGGKSPVVVEQDADLRTAARRIVLGKFINAGQTCISPDYLLVHAAVKEDLLAQLQETIQSFYSERPEESYDYGKIINEKRFDTLTGYLLQIKGKIICGGYHDRSKLFIAPTLIECTTPDQPMMKDEIFGPLLPVFTYQTMEEALAIIRLQPDPLAFYLFARDRRLQKTWMEAVHFGGGCINNTVWHFANPHLPFGGIGNSGLGVYHGKYSFDAFTHAKPVMRTPVLIDPAIKYPPFKGKMKWLKFFIK